jgi:hypothetical protein
VVGRDRLDAVELKVVLPPDQALAAGIWGGDPGEELTGREWFCERPYAVAGQLRLPLLEAGVILRLRTMRHSPDESIAELRPCRRSRLAGHHPSHVEAVWAGEHRVLSVSLTAMHGEHAVTGVLAGHGPLHQLFTVDQQQFLDECADCPVDLGTLTVLGPVGIRRWPRLAWSGMELHVERQEFTTPAGASVAFVELSRRVDRQGAEIAQLALESSLRRRGIEPSASVSVYGDQTRHVLTLLVGASAPPGDSPRPDGPSS